MTLLHSRAFAGALSGLLAAATVDLHAFLKWQTFKDAASYNWTTALFRWAQGIVTGALMGAGYGALVS